MTQDGGQRFATAAGAMLADPAAEFNMEERLFEPAFWAARGELTQVTRGRGSAWFIGSSSRPWALRHYRRGGVIARVVQDRYLWTGEARVRAFAEWRLLAALTQRGLPVPQPVAARYQRSGAYYRCDLITQRILNAAPLSEVLAERSLTETSWRAVGTTVAKLHRAGVYHADLNAHNILLDAKGAVSVIDFDRGRLRPPGPWTSQNLRRLQRSLQKILPGLPPERCSDGTWQWLLAAYDAEMDS